MNCIKQQCYDLLDEINEKGMLNQEVMNKITKLLRTGEMETPFIKYPILIENASHLANELLNWYRDCGFSEKEAIHSAIILGQRTSGITTNKYWFYIEGTNGEEMLDTNDEIIDYIKECIEYDCFICDLSKILCTLTSINNSLWYRHKDKVKLFVKNALPIATACDNIICNDIDYDDTDFALECTINVAHEADYWLKELNIKHNMEPGTGADREIFDKIQLLQKWLNKC
ncbi:MAG: hypothetical protein IKF82_00400 [Bacilli bacterium]|nr:hypothetical protein [Bacilli bacterium]